MATSTARVAQDRPARTMSGDLWWLSHLLCDLRSTLYDMTEIASPRMGSPRIMVLGVMPGRQGTPPFRIVEIDGEVVAEARTVIDVLEVAADYGITVHDLDDPDVVRWVGGDKFTWRLR